MTTGNPVGGICGGIVLDFDHKGLANEVLRFSEGVMNFKYP